MNEVVDINGVKVIGQGNLPGEVARNASEMYSNNLVNLLQEFWDEEAKTLTLDPEDDIVRSCAQCRLQDLRSGFSPLRPRIPAVD